ncbi:MAG: DUF1622 domain-containing protein [Candidatus Omnitrophota bacterium]
MDTFHRIIDVTCFVLNIVGALITIWGTLIALFAFVRKELLKREEAVRLNDSIRIKLGSYLVLALEFFIAADIVRTIITPTWESVGILGVIVVIRTVLSYFLTKDMKNV